MCKLYIPKSYIWQLNMVHKIWKLYDKGVMNQCRPLEHQAELYWKPSVIFTTSIASKYHAAIYMLIFIPNIIPIDQHMQLIVYLRKCAHGFVVFCFVVGLWSILNEYMQSIYPYSSRLFHSHWGNFTITSLKFVITSSAACDSKFVNVMIFPFQW